MGDPDDPLGPRVTAIVDELIWKVQDGSSFRLAGGTYNLQGPIDINTYTLGSLLNQLEKDHHVIVPDDSIMDINFQMCKCVNLNVKARGDLIFTHDAHDNLDSGHILHIKMRDKSAGKRKIGDIRYKETRQKSSKEKRQKTQASVCKQLSKPCGLVNQGLICYANSVLQCYSFTEPLVSYLFGNDYGEVCVSGGKNSMCFLCDLRHFIEESRTKDIMNPEYLITRYMKELGGIIKLKQDQDPHEFLTAINKLMVQSSINHGRNIVEDMYDFQMLFEFKCANCLQTWEGTPFHALVLPIPIIDDDTGKTCASLEEGFKLYFRTENITSECNKCGMKAKVRRRLSICWAPKILTIAFNRAEKEVRVGEEKLYAKKIHGCVEIPTNLELSPFVTNKNTSTSYDLYGVIAHEGTDLETGHYKAYIKTHNETWYCCNDIKVGKYHKSITDVEGYVMFYIRNDTGEVAPPQPTKQHVEEGDEGDDTNAESPHPGASQEEYELEHSQEEHELELFREHAPVERTIRGMPSKPRILSQKHIENRMDERYIIAQDRCRKASKKRIKGSMRFCDPEQRLYHFEMPSMKAVTYDPRLGCWCLPRIDGRFRIRSTQDPATAKKAMRMFFILKTILKNLRRNKPPMCQKEIFYKDSVLFRADSKKKVKDSKEKEKKEESKEEKEKREKKEKNEDYQKIFIPLMMEVVILLETTRYSLNVSVTPRGYFTGDIKLYINGGEKDSCEKGQVISDKVFQINRIKTNGEIKFILILEKYTIYQKLKKMGFDRKYKCIIITPQGFPTLSTRALVKKLSEQLTGVPIYCLVDLNASGALIFSTFMIGSMGRAFDNLDLSVPSIHWIGIFPSDLTGLEHIPKTTMNKTDCKILDNLHNLYLNMGMPREAGICMDSVEHKYNVNIDAMIDPAGGIEKYLRSKIPEMGVIKKIQ